MAQKCLWNGCFHWEISSTETALHRWCPENMQQIYRRTTIPKCNFSKVAKQLSWNQTSPWVFSKFATYFQNIFSQEHIWRAAFTSRMFMHIFLVWFMWPTTLYRKEKIYNKCSGKHFSLCWRFSMQFIKCQHRDKPFPEYTCHWSLSNNFKFFYFNGVFPDSIYMFKVNNGNTDFTYLSGVSIVDFELVNSGWVNLIRILSLFWFLWAF